MELNLSSKKLKDDDVEKDSIPVSATEKLVQEEIEKLRKDSEEIRKLKKQLEESGTVSEDEEIH